MKKIYYLLYIFLLLSEEVTYSQVLEDLEAPSMPAAILIGSQVNEISKPKTFQALETQLLNNFTDSGNLVIPNNYAIEINPFMLSERKNLDYKEYLSDSLKHNLWRNLSLSIASSNNFRINDSVSTNALGLGLRTMFYNGKVNEKLKKNYENTLENYIRLKSLQSQILAVVGAYRSSTTDQDFNLDSLKKMLFSISEFQTIENKAIIETLFKKIVPNTDRNNVRQNIDEAYIKSYTEQTLANLKMLFRQVHTERYGWQVEFDAAFALNFPTNNFDYSYIGKYGIWLSSSYRPYKKDDDNLKIPVNYQFIGLLRWSSGNDDFLNRYTVIDSLSYNPGSAFDLGLRFLKEWDKFSAEVEYIYRLNQNKEKRIIDGNEFSRTINNDTYKLLVNLNYNISPSVVFSYNIGKNFDMPNLTEKNLISGFTVNFGFGKIKDDELIKEASKELGIPIN